MNSIYLILASRIPDVLELLTHLQAPPHSAFNETPALAMPQDLAPAELPGWNLQPQADGPLFVLIDPRLPLIHQLEEWSTRVREGSAEIAKVIAVLDCEAISLHNDMATWTKAVIHYCDVALLGNRENVSKKWIHDFLRKFERECLPCQFLNLKKGGKVDEPELLIYPEARRLSQVFDPPDTGDEGLAGLEIDASCDLGDEIADDDTTEDLYFARLPGGHYVHPVPLIGQWVTVAK